MPTSEAPDLFAYASDGHCYVKRQPSTSREVYQMISAFTVQDVDCIRYKGTNRVIQIRLIGVNEGDQCDHLPQDLSALNEEVKADNLKMRKSRS